MVEGGSPRPEGALEHWTEWSPWLLLLGEREDTTLRGVELYPYLACQSVDAKSLLREVLPRNLQDSNGSEARTRVFPWSKGTPTLKSIVLGEAWDNR